MSSIRTPLTVSPHEYFGDATGRPLDYGTIYFGEPDKDPEFYPIDVYSDEALTQPIPQPIRTKGGFINVNGDIIEIYGRPAIYSVKVLDQYGRKIFYKGKAMRNNVNDDVIDRINEGLLQAGLDAQLAFDAAADKVISDANQSVQNAIRDVAIDANLVTDALTTIVPITTSATARTQLDKNRESVSVLDFFTDEELTAYRADKTTFDAYRPLQEFFTYVAQNDVGVAQVTFDGYIGTGLWLGGLPTGSKTTHYNGTLSLTALNPIDTMITRQLGQDFRWTGGLILRGHTSGGSAYYWANRTCRIGVANADIVLNSRQQWGFIRCFGFQYAGTEIVGTNSASSYAYMRNIACGAGHLPSSKYRLTSTFDQRVDSGNASSGAQRTRIIANYLPPQNCLSARNSYIVVDEMPYLVTDVDYSTNQLTVYPWLPLEVTTGELSYVFGGGVVIGGGDSSSVTFGVIEGTSNGINLNDTALYGCTVSMLMSQACGFGFNIGAQTSSASLGGVVTSYYAEGNHLDFLATSTAISNRTIINSHTLIPEKVFSFSARLNNNQFLGSTIGDVRISVGGTEYRGIKNPNNQLNKPALNFLDPLKMSTVYSARNQTISLPDISVHQNQITGADSQTVRCIGTTKYNAPETVTFEKGTGSTSTINGGDTNVVFRNFAEPPVFTVFAEISTNNYKVILNTRVAISTSVTLAELAAGESATYPIVFDGVKATDFLVARASKPLQGTTIEVSVTSEGNALITHTNNTAAPVTIGDAVLEIKSL